MSPQASRWLYRHGLQSFLRAGCVGIDNTLLPGSGQWTMSALDVERLLRISPLVRVVGARAAQESRQAPRGPAVSNASQSNTGENWQTASQVPAPDVYISYSRRDLPVVREIVKALGDAGLRTFMDAEALAPSSSWTDALSRALKASTAVLICIGPEGVGDRQRDELEAAMLAEAHRVIPVLLPGSEPDRIPLSLQSIQGVDYRDRDQGELRNLVVSIRGASFSA